ncbi:hypothetical protein ACWDR0_10325 [Streptomyces sp. NPDC003691]
MDLTITVRGCDQCKRTDRPATRYTLTVESGEPVTRDLCAEDAAPLEAAFGPLAPAEELSPEAAFKEHLLTLMGEQERENRARRARREAEWREQNAAPAGEAPAEEAPAEVAEPKKAAPKKAASAKKAAPRKRAGTKSLTITEIETLKAEGKL